MSEEQPSAIRSAGVGARPLAGVRVVVTRPAQQSGSLATSFEAAGAAVIELPTIAIEDPISWHPLDVAIRELAAGAYAWVVFTSANGVEKFLSRLVKASLDPSALAMAKVAAVGRATADLLAGHGIRVDVVPEQFTTEALAGALGEGSGRVLLPRVEDAPPRILDVLRGNGWDPHQVPAYRTALGSPRAVDLQRVRDGDFDVITFTSSSTARNFTRLVATPEEVGLTADRAAERRVACIGPVTAATAARLGFRVDAVAREHTDEGLVAAVIDLFSGLLRPT